MPAAKACVREGNPASRGCQGRSGDKTSWHGNYGVKKDDAHQEFLQDLLPKSEGSPQGAKVPKVRVQRGQSKALLGGAQ